MRPEAKLANELLRAIERHQRKDGRERIRGGRQRRDYRDAEIATARQPRAGIENVIEAAGQIEPGSVATRCGDRQVSDLNGFSDAIRRNRIL